MCLVRFRLCFCDTSCSCGCASFSFRAPLRLLSWSCLAFIELVSFCFRVFVYPVAFFGFPLVRCGLLYLLLGFALLTFGFPCVLAASLCPALSPSGQAPCLALRSCCAVCTWSLLLFSLLLMVLASSSGFLPASSSVLYAAAFGHVPVFLVFAVFLVSSASCFGRLAFVPVACFLAFLCVCFAFVVFFLMLAVSVLSICSVSVLLVLIALCFFSFPSLLPVGFLVSYRLLFSVAALFFPASGFLIVSLSSFLFLALYPLTTSGRTNI